MFILMCICVCGGSARYVIIQISNCTMSPLLSFLVAALVAFTRSQIIGGSFQLSPTNSLLNAYTSYNLTFYPINSSLPSTTYFTADFTNSVITVPNGPLNFTATINDIAISTASATCTSGKCTFKTGQSSANRVKVGFTFGTLINPYYQSSQTVALQCVASASSYSNPNYAFTIDGAVYQTMPIIVNSFTQSDYGVGNANVTYSFNLSLPYIPASPSLSIQVPVEVVVSQVTTSLTFYGTVQNVIPTQFTQILVFNLNVTPSKQPVGFLFLTITGLSNPRFMGDSSNFLIGFRQTQGLSCSNCPIAGNNALFASSTTPGNIQALLVSFTNSVVGQVTNATFVCQLFAPIPNGGFFAVILPPSVVPTLPVNCLNVDGLSLMNSSPPTCTYNSATNTVSTSNFAYPNLVSSGNAIFQLQMINSPDSRNTSVSFQTYDASSRLIGISSIPYTFSSVPLTLNATLVRNTTQVQSGLRVAVTLTLQNALSASNLIIMTFPPSTYTLPLIMCYYATSRIPCSAVIDPATLNLIVSLAPPCSQCNVGSVVTFSVDGLINPTFINPSTQQITIQTATTMGVIETNTISVPLTEMTMVIPFYSRNGPADVGSVYQLTLNFSIPPYVVTNGGQLEIDFIPSDTYITPVNTNGTLSYPPSWSVEDGNGNLQFNTILLNGDNPASLQKITITICNPNCPTSIVINSLRRSFTSLQNMIQVVRLNTIRGEFIAVSTFSVAQFNANPLSRSFTMGVSTSVTNTFSAYKIVFISPSIPIAANVVIPLTAQHKIVGGCSVSVNSTSLGYALSCTVLNSTAIALSYQGDPTYMMLDYIQYSVVITSVLNPPSVLPYSFQFTSLFNSVVSQVYTTTYTLRNAYPLVITYTKTNTTYAQSSTITFTIAPGYPPFSEVQISIPTQLMSLSGTVINNAYLITGIYSLTNDTITLPITNPTALSIDNVTLTMYINGYASATGGVKILPVTPVYLGLTLSSSANIVGAATSLTLQIGRVNPFPTENSMIVSIAASVFNLNGALVNGLPVAFPLTVPITTTTLTVTNITNIQYIPNSAPGSILVTTFDSTNSTVAASALANITNILPSVPVDGLGYAFTRSNTMINGVGTISITYTPRYPAIIATLVISLPANQSILSSPSCTLGGSPCALVASNFSSITIGFNASFSSIILNNIINVQPNANGLTIYAYTGNMELVEKSSAQVDPPIQYNYLSLTATVGSSFTGATALLNLSIINTVPIDVGSQLLILLPSDVYYKSLSTPTPQCTYALLSTNYSGCTVGLNSKNIITNITLMYLSASTLPSSTAITVHLPANNNFIAVPFGTIVANVVSPQGYFTSQGSLLLSTVYGVGSLVPAPIPIATASQSSTQANTTNTISLSVTTPIPLPLGTVLSISVPNSTYSPSNSRSIAVACDSPDASLCKAGNTLVQLSITVMNNAFVKAVRDSITVSFQQSGLQVSGVYAVTLPIYTPMPLPVSIHRASLNAYTPTVITLTYNATIPTPYTLIIQSNNWSGAILSNATNAGVAISNNTLSVGVSGGVSTVTLNGWNPLLTPVASECYSVTLQDGSYTYYWVASVQPVSPLIPYSSNLTLFRPVVTVNSSTNLYLTGYLRTPSFPLTVNFNGAHYTILSNPVNISLIPYTNPSLITDSPTFPLTVQTADSYAYLSGAMQITPPLQPQLLTSFINVTLPSSMNILQSVNMSIYLSGGRPMGYLSVVTPAFYSAVTVCPPFSVCSFVVVSNTTNELQINFTTPFPAANNATVNGATVNGVTVTVTAQGNQVLFPNASLIVYSEAPSMSTTCLKDILVYGAPLASSLSLINYHVNSLNNYTLSVTPISATGYITITIPSVLSPARILLNNATVLQSAAGINISVSSVSQLTLQLLQTPNPIDSQPLIFTIAQATDSLKIFGYTTQTTKMTQFDQITVYSTVRSVTKIAEATTVTMDIDCPNYTDTMIITFPISQFTVNTTATVCTVLGQSLPCGHLGNSVKLANAKGRNTYTIVGLSNQKSFNLSTVSDSVDVQIGSPYTRAISNSSSPVTPQLTVGNLQLSALSTSTLSSLTATTLTYRLILENYLNVNSLVVTYSSKAYIIPPSVKCTLNGVATACYSPGNSTLIVSIARVSNILLAISNIVNFVAPAAYTLHTVDSTNSFIDFYYSDGVALAPYTPGSLQMRLILGSNYVQTGSVAIKTMYDTILPIGTPLDLLRFNITSPNCSLPALLYSTQLEISCTLGRVGTMAITLTLYHSLYPSVTLSSNTGSIYIYPSPTSNCANQFCDLCSVTVSREYCFACREGQYEQDGICMAQCSSGLFPYSNACQPCSPTCNTCFGISSDSCLTCKGVSVLQSGTCQTNCTAGYDYSGYCVDNEECSMVEGCRTCSRSGFCYQCLPDYAGEPTCTYVSVLPPLALSYALIPLLLFAISSVLYSVGKCMGGESSIAQFIFSLSLVQLFAWVLTVPVLNNVTQGMLLLAFTVMRIVISIVSYELHYKKNLGELSKKLLEEDSQKEKESKDEDVYTWKTKVVRVLAHFNGPDSYELFRSKIGEPVLNVLHNNPMQGIFMANRAIVMAFMVFVLTQGGSGDRSILPIASVIAGAAISLGKLLRIEKIRSCLRLAS